jgi:DNA-binding NarL/FixJ family response regulator
VQQCRPDVVLIDADLPGVDPIEATRQILADAELSDVRVMILGTFESDDQVFGALRAGATGLLPKDAEPAELLRAVRLLARGEAILAPTVTGRVIAELRSMPTRDRPAPQQLEELTAREREVMSLVAEGLTNHEIAERLVVSPATARTHVSRAMVKLHARDRAQLVVLAYETGLVPPRAR